MPRPWRLPVLYFPGVPRDTKSVNVMGRMVQVLALAGLVVGGLGGCATSTVESRKQERAASYAALTPEWRAVVDHGQLKVGMTADAVYLAWGKPAQVLTGQSATGTTETWLYTGAYMQEYRYWNYRRGFYGQRYFGGPALEYDYYPRAYTRAEVVFENGVVKSWHTSGAPQ